MRRYRCVPRIGEPHRFSVPEGKRLVTGDAPPACPDHPGSKVVRAGTYGKRAAKRRQRYRCTPADGSKSHRFTPPLPRDHVHEGVDHCEHCEEMRGVHRGDTAVTRRHSWSTRVVVRGLEQLAAGASYAEVGRWAQRVGRLDDSDSSEDPDEADTGHADRDGGADEAEQDWDPFAPLNDGTDEEKANEPDDVGAGRRSSARARAARNAWHIGADWVEAFAPVVYEPVDDQLRSAAYNERARLDEMWANGEVLERPQIVLVDDVPVYGRDLDDRSKKSRRDAGFFVLALAETHWEREGSAARLRLVRAMAKSNTPAWRLIFDELGYDPDYVVADAGTGIIAAVEAHFDPARTKFVPSMWHLNQRIGTALADTRGAHVSGPAGTRLLDPLAEHLKLLRPGSPALVDETAWSAWWDELEALLKAHRLPVDKIRTQRRNNEARMAAVLADLGRHPDLPVSTGGLETLIAKHVKPLLAMRRTAFGNLERTNLLFDLVVAAHHGAFDDHAEHTRGLGSTTSSQPPARRAARTPSGPAVGAGRRRRQPHPAPPPPDHTAAQPFPAFRQTRHRHRRRPATDSVMRRPAPNWAICRTDAPRSPTCSPVQDPAFACASVGSCSQCRRSGPHHSVETRAVTTAGEHCDAYHRGYPAGDWPSPGRPLPCQREDLPPRVEASLSDRARPRSCPCPRFSTCSFRSRLSSCSSPHAATTMMPATRPPLPPRRPPNLTSSRHHSSMSTP